MITWGGRQRSKKEDGRTSWPAVALMLLMAVAEAAAQEKTAAAQRRIVVSIPDRKLALVEDGRVLKVYPVAVGAHVSPSPAGEFKIVNRISRPTYYHPGVVIPPGKDNPLGTRWIGLDRKGHGIHGTNQPRSIGQAASHGCVRMAKADLEELFNLVRVGDAVEIRGERDDETAAIFGSAAAEAVAVALSAQVESTGERHDGGQIQ